MSGPVSLKRLHEEIRTARSEIAALAAELRAVETQSAQLAALREDEVTLAARLEQLEQALVPARVAAHCRDAIRRAAVVDAPVAHAVIADLLPPDTYAAIVDALPSPAFFEGRDDTRRQVDVPPKLADTHAIVAWRFVADLVVDAMAPALVERFAAPLLRHVQRFAPAATTWPVAGHGVAPSLGRILRREHGAVMQTRRDRPRHFLTSVLVLARPGDTTEYGSVLRHGDGIRSVPFRANTLLTVVDVAGVHDYEPIPEDASPELARYTYEFPIGPQGWDPAASPLPSDR
jgi:hypothetical protein